jgi:3'-phosphoadenosine 5'-phosphosulfate sulfotransferase (PAPS reductase)/FAD synthetase
MPTREDLKYYQSLPLDLKIAKTKDNIREFVREFGVDDVYVSFSGGKDSTVLLDIARKMYPEIEAVFVNTGLEYPEIQKFVKTFDNVRVVYPKKAFRQVISEYGYPVISKEISHALYSARNGAVWATKKMTGKNMQSNGEKSRFNYEKYEPLMHVDFKIADRCCDIMKKSPLKKIKKMPIIATMAEESALRLQKWLQHGCNFFDGKRPVSNPMSFWRQQDVLKYIKQNNLPISSVYGEIYEKDGQTSLFDTELCTTGCDRTGCIYCGFGAHLEKGEGRFQRLKRTHPRLWEYCIEGGGYDTDGLWKPNDKGLGLRHVFDTLNGIYGDDFIRYE